MSLRTPVEVSACTTAMTAGAGWASSSACGSSGRPQSASTRTTSAPQRPATSHMRSPNTPLTPMTTVSPGRTTLTNAASIPAEPVPLTGNVSGLSVRKTWRSRSLVSSSSVDELGVEVAEQRPGERGRHLGIGIARSGAHEDPIGERHGSIVGPSEQRHRQAVEDVGFADQARVEPEPPHDRHEDAHPADDDVGPRLLEAGVVQPLGAASRWPACGTRPRPPPSTARSGGCGRGRRWPAPARPRPPSTPSRPGRRTSSPRGSPGSRCDVVDVGLGHRQRGDQLLGLGRIVLDVLLGEPHAAHVDRDRGLALRHAVRRTRSSRRRCRPPGTGRAAGRGPRWHRRRRAALPPPRQQLRTGAERGLGRIEELVAVGRVAGGRRGGDPDRALPPGGRSPPGTRSARPSCGRWRRGRAGQRHRRPDPGG